jgi:hypothetical protein
MKIRIIGKRTCASATLSTTNITLIALEWSSGICNEKLTSDFLRHAV